MISLLTFLVELQLLGTYGIDDFWCLEFQAFMDYLLCLHKTDPLVFRALGAPTIINKVSGLIPKPR